MGSIEHAMKLKKNNSKKQPNKQAMALQCDIGYSQYYQKDANDMKM